jgi:hypothetical protein
MRIRQKNQLGRSLFLTILLVLAMDAFAASTWVQGGHAGGWVDPGENGHGLFVQVIVDESSPTGLAVVVAWYAFIDGHQAWIVGIGQVEQDITEQIAFLNAFIYEGNDFPPLYIPSLTVEIPWGVMTLQFDGCDEALLTYNSTVAGFGSGQINLERLTANADSFCNPDLGRNLDNMDDHADYWQLATVLEVKNIGLSVAQEPGEIDSKTDVDVFIFTISKTSMVSVYTRGDTNTTGTLFQLEGNIETELETNEDDGEDTNFLIEQELDPGTYTVHVSAPTLLTNSDGIYLMKLDVIRK